MKLFTEGKRWPVGPMRLPFYSFGLDKGLNQINVTLYCEASQDLLQEIRIFSNFFSLWSFSKKVGPLGPTTIHIREAIIGGTEMIFIHFIWFC
jgi:hypothetical protein